MVGQVEIPDDVGAKQAVHISCRADFKAWKGLFGHTGTTENRATFKDALYGWPRSRSNDSSHCEAAAWLSRLLLIMLAVMINGALY